MEFVIESYLQSVVHVLHINEVNRHLYFGTICNLC